MYELKQVGEKTYYIQSPAKIGIYKPTEKDVYLIDTGNDKDAGRRVRKLLDEQEWELKGIINTHANADHIGGNKYLQNQKNCKIFASDIEDAITENPILEPAFLYGGYPPKELRNKFLMAQPSSTVKLSDKDFPSELEVLNLPGHFFNMIGILTPDKTAFIADCLSSKETLEKYQVSFIYDVQKYLDTLEYVKTIEAEVFVPSHAEETSDITELADINRDKVLEIADTIKQFIKEEIIFEKLLQKIFDHYKLAMNFDQYVLVGSTIKSYLAWLKDNGEVEVLFKDNLLMWKRMD